jgi:hypothetical protein
VALVALRAAAREEAEAAAAEAEAAREQTEAGEALGPFSAAQYS